jgi:gamma-glutamyltranspeptidase
MELPPNGQEIIALQMLKLLDIRYARIGLGIPNSFIFYENKTLLLRSCKIICDPAFAPVPINELISKEYA